MNEQYKFLDVLRQLSVKKPEDFSLEEEVVFLREILANVKANMYINQVDDLDDLSTAQMVWLNQDCADSMGFTYDEVREMGNSLYQHVIHPDDAGVKQHSVDFHALKKGDVYGGLVRFVSRNKDIKWFVGTSVVLNVRNEKPWQFLNVAINIQDELQTKKQLLDLQRENMQLKNSLKLKSLTKRELVILKRIALGQTDKEIAAELKISEHTARTHRRNLLAKLEKNKTAELAVFASECGIL